MTDQEPKLWEPYQDKVCRICNQVIKAHEKAYAYPTGNRNEVIPWEHKVCAETAIDGQTLQEEMLNRIMTIEIQVDALYHRFFDKDDKELKVV
jgi:hypothetical protein